MTTSLSNHGRSAHPADGFDEDPYGGDNPCEARLRGLDRQQLTDRLNWLSWYQPGIFAAVMDYGQFSDDLAADTDPPTQTQTSTTPRTWSRCAPAAALSSGSSSSSACSGAITAGEKPSARRRSSTRATSRSWPGASPARPQRTCSRRFREPRSAPPPPAGRYAFPAGRFPRPIMALSCSGQLTARSAPPTPPWLVRVPAASPIDRRSGHQPGAGRARPRRRWPAAAVRGSPSPGPRPR